MDISSSADSASSVVSSASPESGTIDESMFLYTDTVLGFSLRLPKRVYAGPTLPSVEVSVFEDHEHQRDFVAVKEWDKNVEGNSMQKTTLKHLQESDYPPGRWEILSRPIQNDGELQTFIKERYGKDCRVGEKLPTKQAGTWDVKIGGFTMPEDGDCFVNYATVIRYSPSRQQVIFWNMGQDVNFVAGMTPDSRVYDDDIVDSFRFLQ